ncbi:MAG: DNA repair protein RecO [Paludibacteraceae bacterium]|nr:DNA repair protein RecO [Paludibacteraceae bacterium]
MLTKTKGIVLRTFKYADNKCLTHILTPEHGKITYAVYAPQSKRSKVHSNMLQPLSLLEIIAEHKPNRTIQQIKEARALTTGVYIIKDPARTAMAMFIAETTDACVYEEHIDSSLFLRLENILKYLDSEQTMDSHFALRFLIELSDSLGFNPTYDSESIILDSYLNSIELVDNRHLFLKFVDACKSGDINIFSHTERQTLLRLLLGYFRYNLPDMPEIKSVEVLEEIFS